jgi:hypothetical protein
MAHFAKMEDNIVREVIVVDNEVLENKSFPESEPLGIAFCKSLFGNETEWKQCSYNATFRKNYPGSGFSFVADLNLPDGAFISPSPYPSWILNDTTCQWEAPIPYPTDGKKYVWDELTLSWIEVE